MPTIPVYGSTQVAPAPLPAARRSQTPSQESFGGGNALPQVDLSGGVKLATSIYDEEKRKADQVAITDAAGRLSALETQLLYGQNGQGGVLSRQGRDAFTAPDDVKAQWQQTTAEIAGQLGNDDQRLAFERMSVAHYGDVNAQVQRHVASQRQAYDTESTNTLVANEKDAAIQNYLDAPRIQLSIDRQTATLTDFAQRHTGLPDGWLQQQLTQARSATYAGVIDRMLANEQDLDASAFYAVHKDEIAGSTAIPLERALDEGSVRGASQRQADAITASAPTLSAALTQVHGIQDPRLRDATEDRVRRSFQDKALGERQAQDVAFQSAGQILEQTGDVHRIPPSMWMTLSTQDRASLQHRQDQMRDLGSKTRTNFDTYYKLMNMASLSDASQQMFSSIDLMSYRNQLSDEDFRHLVEVQRQSFAAPIRAERKAEADSAKRAQAMQTLRDMGVKVPEAVPGAPIAKPEASPNVVIPELPKTDAGAYPRVTLPQTWIEEAQRKPKYKVYLNAHGYNIP